MTQRYLAVLAGVVVVFGVGAGFAIGQANDDVATAAGAGNAVVKELRKLNRETVKIRRELQAIGGEVRETGDDVDDVRSAIGTGTHDFNSVLYLLDETCAAVKGRSIC